MVGKFKKLNGKFWAQVLVVYPLIGGLFFWVLSSPNKCGQPPALNIYERIGITAVFYIVSLSMTLVWQSVTFKGYLFKKEK